jgi:hypothetical protein
MPAYRRDGIVRKLYGLEGQNGLKLVRDRPHDTAGAGTVKRAQQKSYATSTEKQ